MLAFAVRTTLRDFALEIEAQLEDGVTVVVGASGAGKSTLLRLLAGLQRAEAGRITLGSRVLYDARTFVPPYRRNIGVVFQDYALFPHLDVAANVGYGLFARNLRTGAREAAVARALDMLEIRSLAHERVTELSGGQRQRVALARALAIQPDALLLDEPLAALDPATRERVRRELAALFADVRVPVLLVTHDEADRAAFPGRTLHIAQGRVVQAVA